MRHINIDKIIYHIRHRYLTTNNVVIAVALVIAASLIWGSLDTMQKNYARQKEIDYMQRELALTQLQRDNLSLQNSYYETAEYQELAVRESLGLVRPGESVLILPKNTASADEETTPRRTVAEGSAASNLEQWVNFLFGGHRKSIEAE